MCSITKVTCLVSLKLRPRCAIVWWNLRSSNRSARDIKRPKFNSAVWACDAGDNRAEWVTRSPSLVYVAAGVNPAGRGSILAVTRASTRHTQYQRSLFGLIAVRVGNFPHSLAPVTARGALCDKWMNVYLPFCFLQILIVYVVIAGRRSQQVSWNLISLYIFLFYLYSCQ